MRNVSNKYCRENQNTFYFNFFLENLAVYEITWTKIGTAGQDTDDNRALGS